MEAAVGADPRNDSRIVIRFEGSWDLTSGTATFRNTQTIKTMRPDELIAATPAAHPEC